MIHEEVMFYHVHVNLNIAAFTKGKSQLNLVD